MVEADSVIHEVAFGVADAIIKTNFLIRPIRLLSLDKLRLAWIITIWLLGAVAFRILLGVTVI